MTAWAATPQPDIESIRQFLYLEARLLDRWDLKAWLELFEDELSYWIPVRHDSSDPAVEVQHAYDDRTQLAERVTRLLGPHAYAQQPRSQLSRIVANVTVESVSENRIDVRSTFLLTELRRSSTDLWAGETEHSQRPIRGLPGYTIAAKKVLLLASEEPIDNLTFLL